MKKEKLESIQLLRGLAALSVVMFHYRFYLVPDGADRTIPDQLFGWGAIGVDLFFVISGFIMVYVSSDKKYGTETSMKFIINRLTRILPTYYVLLLFAFLTGGAMSTFHYPEKVSNLISALTFHPYLTKPAPLYLPDSGMYNIRWTLNYEIYFYLAFSICLLVKPRITALCTWFLLPIALAYTLTSTFTVSTHGYDFNSVMLRFLTNPIILEFGIGALTGYTYLYLKNKDVLNSAYLSILCLALIVAGIALGQLKAYNVISACAFFFLVLFFALQSQQILKFTPKLLIMLGNISFSWYLIHNPLAGFISGKVDKFYPGAMHSTLGFIILIVTSIFFAWLSHKYLELKLTAKVRFLMDKITSFSFQKDKKQIN
ncbi:acyltransferase (plasmid) [Erwinia tracheiphila]|uniref:acyltransferase family protein n=1 Tax=Erwinia tracheiphila TaxID=65700 RepID=UPI001F3961E4|nr:acyltransferase [Erwinia tracheiphila]UIA94530.1 acyltransferase [Erwinia tracheiphila]